MFLLGCSNLHAQDQWLCTEEASQRHNDTIFACGVGSGADEGEARLAAFDNSKAEFNRICDSSSDCAGHKITTLPRRTSCELVGSLIKCYRLILYTIGNDKADVAPVAAAQPMVPSVSTPSESIQFPHYSMSR